MTSQKVRISSNKKPKFYFSAGQIFFFELKLEPPRQESFMQSVFSIELKISYLGG